MTYTRSQIEIDRMAEMRLEGATLQQIGDHFDLTRERIRQILAKEGVTKPWPGYQPVHYRRWFHAVSTAARLTVQYARPGDPAYPHGTINGYARGCSCAECRRANRERLYTAMNPRPDWQVAKNDGSRRAARYYERARSRVRS